MSELGITADDLRELYSKPEFDQLLQMMGDSDPRFLELPIEQQKLAIALVLKGNVNAIEDLWKTFYRRQVPSMKDFLSYEHIGSNSVFYPEDSLWRRDLETIFSEDSNVYEWVLTGAIGTAKTSNAMIGQFYNLFRVTSLRFPQLAMGSGETKPLALMLLTVSKMKADEMLKGIRTLLKASKYFVKVSGEKDFEEYQKLEFCDYTPYYESKVEEFPRINFPNNIYIGTGSNLGHTIGSDIFGAVLDEAEFRGKTAEKAFEFYSELMSRVVSRFRLSKFKLVNLVSSIKHETGIIATHIKDLESDPNSPYHYISSYPIWDIKPDYKGSFEKYGHFWVMRGTKSNPSKVLDDEEQEQADNGYFEIPDGCKLVKVPADPILVKDFNINVERNLMEKAGEYTSGGERPFDNLSTLEDEQLTAEIELVAPLQGISKGKTLFEQLPEKMWVKTPDGLKLRRYPNAKRYIHLDLAETGEGGIAMVHKEICPDTGNIIYVTDFVAKITSPNRISFKMIENFLKDLKLIGNVFLQRFTADQYQSTSLLQEMETFKLAVEVKRQAIGTKPPPFNEVSTLIGEDSVKTGKASELKKQMKSIYFIGDNVEYEEDRKDMADALVGTIYSAKWCTVDVPTCMYIKDAPPDKFANLEDALGQFREL